MKFIIVLFQSLILTRKKTIKVVRKNDLMLNKHGHVRSLAGQIAQVARD